MMENIDLHPLPPQVDLETIAILRALADARASLAELKGTAKILPNQRILIDSLILQEALASSNIENIVTTQDEAFRARLFSNGGSVEAKEVARYGIAMRQGYEAWKTHEFISERMLIEMFQNLKGHTGEYRKEPGVVIRNQQTGETVYTPPQDPREIQAQMQALMDFVNDTESSHIDSLVKMALIHHQFESIHPFSDGNGRVGRMLNVLYLTHSGLLDMPILCLSRPINRTKPEYYRLLQEVRGNNAWEDWIIYMLVAVAEAADSTLRLISDFHELMLEVKHRMRTQLPKIYSRDLLNNLFRNPYTTTELLEQDLAYGEQTARKYLKLLAKHEFVREVKHGRNKCYVNQPLADLFVNVPDPAD